MNNNRATSVDPDILTLVKTVYSRMQTTTDDWVTWRKIAKHQEGSDAEEIVIRLRAIGDLPQARIYLQVSKNGNFVKLTEEGVKLAISPGLPGHRGFPRCWGYWDNSSCMLYSRVDNNKRGSFGGLL